MQIGDHVEKTVFMVTDIGPEDVIVGLDWVATACDTGVRPTAHRRSPKSKRLVIGACRRTVLPDFEPEEDLAEVEWDEADLIKAWEQGITIPGAPQLFVAAGHTYSQLFAKEEIKKKVVKTAEESVPKQYHEFLKVLSKEASERLPERKPYNHAIELVPGYSTFHSKVYPLSNNEQEELDKFLKEQLAKGYIRESKSPISSPFFFIKKKEGMLRPVQDYRRLNVITVKNCYPLPLIAEMVDKLRGATLFTKFDVRWGYNNIRIKAGDEWKAAFVTNRGLYEPLVMFFGLTNSPVTFQAMMNDICHDLIIGGKVLMYLDDILIFSTNKEEHEKVTRKVLRCLQDNNLFLKPEKCEWDVPKVDYISYVFGGNEVAMDPAKLKGINEWPVPQNKKDVQKFRGFSNFYRRFIKDFAKISRPLDQLTGNDPWHWGEEEQHTFNELKQLFATTPVLVLYDPNRETRIEVDASGYATGGVLMQKQDNSKWHPIAFRSHAMDPAQRNYEIYDKEMLAIIEALTNWRHYLEGLPNQFEIVTDHKNLEYWHTLQHLMRCQARWLLFLAHFDFHITHKAGTLNGKADALSH
ncbi:hypothetical protein IEO21_10244 [Rhodonia placenta]|uniref:Reverse transcriptase domain-containing protein n=1 Tax=Rhodonia placenta TaxID=104341 RepID=A0A8H7TWY7_9APHY|nr:hypothetical protein IEO21_10244 [Postia placenta]